MVKLMTDSANKLVDRYLPSLNHGVRGSLAAYLRKCFFVSTHVAAHLGLRSVDRV